MVKKVAVKPHFRKGKPVSGHERSMKSVDLKNTLEIQGPIRGVRDLADDNSTDPTVTNGAVFDNVQFKKEGLGEQKLFKDCVFKDCYFLDSDLAGLKFVGCEFNNCVMSGIDLSSTSFKDCKFDRVDFENSIDRVLWRDTRFENCIFDQCSLESIYLEDGHFSECTFRNFLTMGHTRLEKINFRESKFNNPKFINTDLDGSVFESCSIENGWFEKIGKSAISENGARMVFDENSSVQVAFYGGELVGCRFENSRMAGTEMSENRLDNCEFKKCDLQDIELENVTGEKLLFHKSELRGSQFVDSNLNKVDFNESHLGKTVWDNTQMDCNFTGDTNSLVYHQHSFDDSLAKSGLLEKQFEFMILSGVIEVRDDETLEKVGSGFNPKKHHVPPWSYENIELLLPVQKT